MNGKIISVFNNKGGTGKTTSTINIGAILNEKGYNVLLIDLDSQFNLTSAVKGSNDYSILDALENKRIDEEKLFKYKENLFVLTGNQNLVELDAYLNRERIAKEKKIIKLLEPLKDKFDFILIDNPPNISISVLNSLFASDYFITPVEADFFSQKGLANILSLTNEINEERKEPLKCLGFFFTRFLANTRMSNHFRSELQDEILNIYLDSPIRQNVTLAEAILFGEDITTYDKKSNGYLDYLNLTNSILDKLK